jgi:hypothetical protein
LSVLWDTGKGRKMIEYLQEFNEVVGRKAVE